ncbi:hypothetical protein [Nocardioides sp. zg-1228]|uniref:hypothetical protein n=1 Tax=Nocardioides sp. zg-1228 TaxID=2763008 RepID=UPI001642AAE7|nr:hypothetical protein [Nocardioides sp. zg-1228]MBC2931649.1 hypothetical protein [Nocardioides sp. zg-1228]QSF57240.1 hypothetical protein JX575_17025 [Nocardioides sp. zg-1228]
MGANIPAEGEYVRITGAHYCVRANACGEVNVGNPSAKAAGNFLAAGNGLSQSRCRSKRVHRDVTAT